MKYRAFGNFQKGYAHVKNGSGVEDYASSYNDPEGRYYIAVICDGHSDKNCFRSGKGAQFGCESAIEILTRFFELYYEQDEKNRKIPEGTEERLKRSIKQCWDKKVFDDIAENPIVADDLATLSDRVRKIYESGQGLQNIYGATFLATALCDDFFFSMHIGDGVILCVDRDGTYYYPLPKDEKSETGAPASLCDSDLFSRANAFRIGFTTNIPQIATVSSDGIEDSMDAFEYKRFTYSLFKKLEMDEAEEQQSNELNEKQKKYFESCLEYYAGQGHGAEDDCSLSAVYDLEKPVPDVKIPLDEAIQLWEQTVKERNEVVCDYESRKENLLKNIWQIQSRRGYKAVLSSSLDDRIEIENKVQELKRILKTIIENEKEKISFYDRQLDCYSEHIKAANGDLSRLTMPVGVQNISDFVLEKDAEDIMFEDYRQEYQARKKAVELAKRELESVNEELDRVYDEAKRIAKSETDDSIRMDAKNSVEYVDAKYKQASEAYKNAVEAFEIAEKEYKAQKEYRIQKEGTTADEPKKNTQTVRTKKSSNGFFPWFK